MKLRSIYHHWLAFCYGLRVHGHFYVPSYTSVNFCYMLKGKITKKLILKAQQAKNG